ncbi:MAG TPA: hypothetical protein VKE96_29340 [Vicinamibacterales bacterium]|nr:hypothetical protein [Vicinamibacterales bacterium]
MTSTARALRAPGAIAAVALGIVLLAFAATLDLPRETQSFKGDEATYYSLTKSIATDFDFAFERKDLTRVWEEFRGGPEGIFLKRGKVNRIRSSTTFPFVRRVKLEDPVRTRLYYAKSFIYPLVAAPFVFFFGTHGFLVLHALLLSLDLFVAYCFLTARGSEPIAALAFAVVFLGASVVPVYFVWMTPEFFNLSLVFYAVFFWAYKEAAPEGRVAASRFLTTSTSDLAAAAIIGVLTFSKLSHAILVVPLVAVAAYRRQWGRVAAIAIMWAAVTGTLFAANAAITGEFNYQAGDRKTFYGRDGFPFANDRETFESIGPVRERGSLMVGDVLANEHTFTVLGYNLVYFFVGRFCGLVPYFFPGVLSLVLFLGTGGRRVWQWLLAATIAAAALVLLVVTPFTYSGGGGPVGNRYFLSFYPAFLFLTPALAGLQSAVIALAVGAAFTAQIVLNPIFASLHPGEHTKSGPLHALPIELTLLNDLPMAFDADRSRRPLAGNPPMLAYFPDEGAFSPEGDSFWVRGKSRADVVLRAPVADLGGDRFVSKKITRLAVEVQNGGDPGRVTVSTAAESRMLVMKPAEIARFTLAMPAGVPYHRDENPTSYLYVVSFRTTAGFVPFLDAPNSSDSRFLGAHVRLVPEYADAETTVWRRDGITLQH